VLSDFFICHAMFRIENLIHCSERVGAVQAERQQHPLRVKVSVAGLRHAFQQSHQLFSSKSWNCRRHFLMPNVGGKGRTTAAPASKDSEKPCSPLCVPLTALLWRARPEGTAPERHG